MLNEIQGTARNSPNIAIRTVSTFPQISRTIAVGEFGFKNPNSMFQLVRKGFSAHRISSDRFAIFERSYRLSGISKTEGGWTDSSCSCIA